MITWGPPEQTAARDALFNAVKSGRIPRAVFDARVRKVAEIKQQLGPLLRRPASLEKMGTFNSKTMARLDDQVLQKNLTEEFSSSCETKNERTLCHCRTHATIPYGFRARDGSPCRRTRGSRFFKDIFGELARDCSLTKNTTA